MRRYASMIFAEPSRPAGPAPRRKDHGDRELEPRQGAKRSRVADNCFPRNEFHATFSLWLFTMNAAPARLTAGSGAKVWSETKIPLGRLQGFEIKQNGQGNLWKSLEKKARNLEMFGAGLEKLAPPSSGPSGRLLPRRGRRAGRPAHTCSTATTPLTAFSAPASAPVTA
jgi:hypothetical protein